VMTTEVGQKGNICCRLSGTIFEETCIDWHVCCLGSGDGLRETTFQAISSSKYVPEICYTYNPEAHFNQTQNGYALTSSSFSTSSPAST
jgi:hypothetical protein